MALGCIIALIAAIAGCARNPVHCPSPPMPRTVQVPPLSAGEYELSLRAECGSRSGNEASGRLSLLPTHPNDRSPVTGEKPHHLNLRRNLPVYGFTDLDFTRVGAPICDGESALPTSRNPMNPGVVLDLTSWREIDPAVPNLPTLLVGTTTNTLTNNLTTDGCGIALSIETWDGHCYRSHWDHAGIVGEGNGTFRVCPNDPRPDRRP